MASRLGTELDRILCEARVMSWQIDQQVERRKHVFDCSLCFKRDNVNERKRLQKVMDAYLGFLY